MAKKIFKWVGIVLLVLIGTAFAAPFLFKGKIIEIVKKQINENVNAKVDFKDVDISFFRHFPKVAVGLDELSVVGNDVFAKDTLFAAQRIDAALNIMSVISGKDMTIYSIDVESPRVHAIVDKSGAVNWDISKKDTTKTTDTSNSKPFKMALQHYAIKNAYISYVDSESNMSTEIFGLNHEGKGDFTSDLFTLQTTTTADVVNYSYHGIPFVSNAKATADADIQVDNKTNTYSFKTDKISFNDLNLSSEGYVKSLTDTGYAMDIKFKTPTTSFKQLLSLIPSIYKNDFDKIKTDGSAVFDGYVKGTYSATSLPGYFVDMQVNNGFFQYPDLPMPVKNITVKAQLSNPDGQTDNTVVDIQQGHIEMANDPFDFRLLLKKPISNMFVDAAAKGKLDLSKVTQFVKLEQGTKLSGLINADVNVKGNVNDIEQQHYDKFSAGGSVNINNLFYASKDYPQGVRVNNLQSSFTPAKVDIANLSMQFLKSNITGSGQINNLLPYMLKSKPLNAALSVSADYINLNDWMGLAADTSSAKTATTPVTVFPVPGNLDILLDAKAGKVHYDNLDIQNLSGNVKIKDETVSINNVKGDALDGTIGITGSYSTKESKTKPAISFSYNVTDVDIQKTFYAFNTVQKLMPIGKFLAGKFNSQLAINGSLGDNMMPDLSSLTGNGNVLLLQGVLSKFAPLDKIASTLNVPSLQQVSLKDIKTYFEFANGKILVKPFTVKIGDVSMDIGGTQGIDQSLDYIINMKLPRTLLGTQGNQLINNLTSQLNNKGVPVSVGETVNLALNLGGFMNAPSVKTNLKQGAESMADQLKQQATDFAKAKVDSVKTSVKNAVKDTVASIKNQAINSAKDELAKKVLGKSDTTNTSKPTDIKESAKGLLNNIFKKKN
ncbi:AsmA-like C-terminal region-containing protein [Ferruginibacter albus]|uniref:AsmA-like C-terminal region-containing protein n=1 Tax=Ferruginibacter albus TaxID=2875540 RepID=UPI001CC63A8A|nr:AsmA-like C-terminal region-containing protein [Ferruginibacter albus]UAY51157.1 hypothetical protein K9M53_11210 [Ferruginibacter albus]